MIMSENSHESHFGLGKLLCHESDFEKAIHQFNEAKNKKKDDYSYITWLCMARAFEPSSDKVLTKSVLNKLPQEIEVLWILMEISLQGKLHMGT